MQREELSSLSKNCLENLKRKKLEIEMDPAATTGMNGLSKRQLTKAN